MSLSHVVPSCRSLMSFSHVVLSCRSLMSFSRVVLSCRSLMSFSHVVLSRRSLMSLSHAVLSQMCTLDRGSRAGALRRPGDEHLPQVQPQGLEEQPGRVHVLRDDDPGLVSAGITHYAIASVATQ